jgi:hypothetical protein
MAFTVRDLIKLTDKKARREVGLCIVEGEKLVRELRGELEQVFVLAGCEDRFAEFSPFTVLPRREFDRVTAMETSQGVLALARIRGEKMREGVTPSRAHPQSRGVRGESFPPLTLSSLVLK